MGVYDTYGEVQLKVGEVAYRQFHIGDKTTLPDGIYVGLEGFVVIVDGIFIAEFEKMFTKWGGIVNAD